jgi:hypothetical protein
MSLRLPRILGALGVLITISGFPFEASAAKFAYLRDAAREIVQISHSHTALSLDDAGRIAKIACEALTRLINDPDFKSAIQSIGGTKFQQNRAAGNQLIREVREFNEKFLTIEQENLRDVGYDPQTIKEILDSAEKIRSRAGDKDLTPKAVEEVIRNFQENVCKAALNVRNEEQAREIIIGFFGVALIVGDMAGEILTAGVGTAPVVASVGLGVALTATEAEALQRNR